MTRCSELALIIRLIYTKEQGNKATRRHKDIFHSSYFLLNSVESINDFDLIDLEYVNILYLELEKN